MLSSTSGWNALGSQNEKLADSRAAEGPAAPAPAAERPSGRRSGGGRHRGAGRVDAGPRWRVRGRHAAAPIFSFGD
jgi:hypothetical protein